MRSKKLLVILLLGMTGVLIQYSEAGAQKKKLSFKQVYNFSEPRLTGQLPRIEGWLDSDNYLEIRSAAGGKSELMKVNAETGKAELYIDYAKVNAELPEGFAVERADEKTDDYSGFIFNQKNDLYYYSPAEREFKRLTKDDQPEKNPKFSPDGQKIAYTKMNNLYVFDIQKETETQLTTDGADLIYNGWASWLYYEEILGRSSRYAAFWWAPNSEYIAFLRFDDNPVPDFPLYRADGQHGELEHQRYPKAGDPNPLVKLGIVNLTSGKTVWGDFDEKADQYIAWPVWTKNNKLTVQWMNRGQDNIIIYYVDLDSGKKSELYNEKQPAWVEWFEDLYFFNNNSGFIIRTNVDGWNHLYYYGLDGKLKSKLTDGEWGVSDIAFVDEKTGKVYFHGAKEKSTDKQLYIVSLEGTGLVQLTKESGTHSATISDGGKYFIDRFSNITTPSQLNLYSGNGKLVKNLADSKTPAMDEFNLGKPELFTIPSGDGYELPAQWVLPPDFDANKKYPVLFSIYGGPGSASVRNSFPYFMEGYYMAQNGIIYIVVDNRGSGHFGKKGMNLMHRNLGKWEMYDLIAAVKWLKSKPFIDSTRIGITGGSYGGYTTCMALTYGADYFTHGVAQFSVTDWQLYDSHYTERYMDTPAENPDGYKNGSVLTWADKYKGHLRITHGTMDDNVHMQNTIQFIYELEKMDKDFELMIYPNARHGIGYPLRNHSTRENVKFWFNNFLGKELDISKD